MGWTFCYDWRTRAEMLAYLRSTSRIGINNEMVKSQAVGNNHWYVCRNKETGTMFLGLDLMKGGTRRDPGWGYKDLSEGCGPCEVNCPLSYLALVGEPTGYAVEWRESVREYHARRNTSKPVPGMRVEYCGVVYVLQTPYAPRKGWRVLRESDGQPFRLKATQLSKSRVLPDLQAEVDAVDAAAKALIE